MNGLKIIIGWWGVPERAAYELFRKEMWERYSFDLKHKTWSRILRSPEPPPIVFMRLVKELTGLPADIWFPREREDFFRGFAPPLKVQKPELVVEQVHAQNPWLAQGQRAWKHQVAAGIRPKFKIVVPKKESNE